MSMDEGHPFIKALGKIFGGDSDEQKQEEKMEDEIIQMVSEGHEQGAIDAQEAKMISNIMEFDDKLASEVMTHRKILLHLMWKCRCGKLLRIWRITPIHVIRSMKMM